jgi:Transposase, Mutator family
VHSVYGAVAFSGLYQHCGGSVCCGLVAAIGAALPGAAWQRRRSHYLRNLLTRVPKSAQPWIATLVRTIFDQPDADAVTAQFARVVDTIAGKYPDAANHLDAARDDLLAFASSRTKSGNRCGATIRRSDSTRKSAAAPTSSASSPTGPP